jgi:4-alpha-glucanotransferase
MHHPQGRPTGEEKIEVIHPRDDEIVHELAELAGIEPEYYDNWGNLHITSPETKKAILSAMGFKDPGADLKRLKTRPWDRLIEPVLVVSESAQPDVIPIHFPLAEGSESKVVLTLNFEDEYGNRERRALQGITPAAENHLDGVRHVRVDIPNDTNRPTGYYSLDVHTSTPEGEFTGRMRIIVAPDRCHTPESRTWGISINLYSLRSERNWGCGDLGDLGDFVNWVDKDLGGGFVGINPLHAIPNRMPYGISPYSSTSRLYRNFIYLDMERVLEGSPEGKGLMGDPGFIKQFDDLKGPLIDYEKSASIKLRALEAAFGDFYHNRMTGGTPEAESFRRYIKAEGRALEDFAAFMAIKAHLRKQASDVYDWRNWPPEYRNHNGPAVREFVASHEKDIVFYQYVQWLIEEQLSTVSDSASGMPIGLYNDLAVGSSGQGSDAWSNPEVFALGVAAGAPPDAFNLNGQDWGFPPLIPEGLMESGYELFIKTIRQNLRHAGALRIDHAPGLFRLFYIPEGMHPREGTYVRYPSEDLLRIIALESVRNRSVIIAEDLGTVGNEAREALSRFGMLSYRLFYFERDWTTGAFLPPEAYPEMSLSAVTTHDLPTLHGYWAGRDIEVKKELGLYPDEAAFSNDIETRARDRQLMLEALDIQMPEGAFMDPALSIEIHSYLARTRCRLVAVSLDDILGVTDQQNMPGTIDTHPNWRQKVPVDLDHIFRNEQAEHLAQMFGRESRRTSQE